MDSEETSQQLKGVVIITLPPPDNPSLGKTITAFTLTNDVSPQSRQTQQHLEQQEHNLPVQLPTPPQNLFSGTPRPRKLLGFLAISLFALLVYSSVFSNTLQELKESNNDQKAESFIFPLYHKLGIRGLPQRDLELKLGGFVEVDKASSAASMDRWARGTQKISKFIAANAVARVDSSTILPVKGNIYPEGLYFTYMLVGNPRRPYFLDIDTGSDLTWIQCDAPCASCAKGANPLYKPTRRNIVLPKDSLCMEIQKNQKSGYCDTCQQCDYEIDYADHSSSMGVLARDRLHLMASNGSFTKLNIVFGCAYDQQGLLLNTLEKTDGIIGLSRSKVSLPSQLASKGITKNVIGHCLATDAVDGGYMFVGDDYVPNWGMDWVPMLQSPTGLYLAEILKINYESSSLSLGGKYSNVGRVIFDSGSSYSYFPRQTYSELVASLNEVSTMGLIQDASDSTLPVCWQAKLPIRSVTDVKQFFKTLMLQFGSKWRIISKKLSIPPEGYLIINSKGNVCLGILDGSDVHDGSTIILGDISMRGQLLVYDNVNQKIGWAKSDCVKPRTFKSVPFFEG